MAQSTWKKSAASIVAACARRNCRQVVSVCRFGAGGIFSASGGAYAFGDANPISNIELDGHGWCSWLPAGCGVANDVTSAFASGYHDFINVARSARHVIAARARVVGHGLAPGRGPPRPPPPPWAPGGHP